jgi:hypothetical protein
MMSGIAAASGNWRDADCRGECPTRRAHPWCAPCTDRRRAERRTCAALRPTRLKGSRAGGVTQHECDEGWNVARAEKVARARSARASNSSSHEGPPHVPRHSNPASTTSTTTCLQAVSGGAVKRPARFQRHSARTYLPLAISLRIEACLCQVLSSSGCLGARGRARDATG